MFAFQRIRFVFPRFTLLLIVVATTSLFSMKTVRAEPKAQRPNILFAFADDWGRQASAYRGIGDADSLGLCEVVSTPNFDAIAKRGVLFTQAFVNAPSCTPCRSSLMSGQHFFRTGRAAILQGAIWDSKIPSWPRLLRASGYHTGFTHKVWSPGEVRDAPYGDPKHRYAKGNMDSRFSQFVTDQVANKKKTVAQAKAIVADLVRQNFNAFLDDRESEDPFCYFYGPTNVHRKWTWESGTDLWGLNPDDLKGQMPPFLPDVPTIRQDLVDYLGEVQAFDAALGVLMAELKSRNLLDNTLVIVSGDHGPAGFPHGKCNLYEFGSGVSLAIAGPGVNAKWGDENGENGEGRIIDDLVSLPDLAPTILEAASLDVPDVMTAKSIWPSLKSRVTNGTADEGRTHVIIGRERHVASARADFKPYPQRAIRTQEFLLIRNFKPERFPLGDPYGLGEGEKEPSFKDMEANTFVTLPDEDAGPTKAWIVSHRQESETKVTYDKVYGKRPEYELYDLAKDPHQMNNVAGEPAYRESFEDLRDRLQAELLSTADPRLVDDGKFFETSPMSDPVGRKRKKR